MRAATGRNLEQQEVVVRGMTGQLDPILASHAARHAAATASCLAPAVARSLAGFAPALLAPFYGGRTGHPGAFGGPPPANPFVVELEHEVGRPLTDEELGRVTVLFVEAFAPALRERGALGCKNDEEDRCFS